MHIYDVIMHNDGNNKIPTVIYSITGDQFEFDFPSCLGANVKFSVVARS